MADLIEAGSMAPGQLTGKTWKIKVLEGDRQGSSAYYPKEALQEGAHLFAKGTRIYADHPTKDDNFNRPARSIRDIVGYLSENASFDGKDLYANATFFPEHQDFIKSRAEAGVIGMSIRASGELSEAGGTKTLTKFTAVQSVDVVTVPGAGGGFNTLLESENNSAAESVAESQEKEKASMEKELAEALTTLSASLKEDIAAAVAEAFKPFAKAKADAEDKKDGGADDADENADGTLKKKKPVKESASFAEIDAALSEAKLPSASRATVFALVEDGGVLAEVVEAESAKVKSILEEAERAFHGHFEGEGKPKSLEEVSKSILKDVYGLEG